MAQTTHRIFTVIGPTGFMTFGTLKQHKEKMLCQLRQYQTPGMEPV